VINAVEQKNPSHNLQTKIKYSMWEPNLSCKHWHITFDAIYWHKCYTNLLTMAALFSCGSFKASTQIWSAACRRIMCVFIEKATNWLQTLSRNFTLIQHPGMKRGCKYTEYVTDKLFFLLPLSLKTQHVSALDGHHQVSHYVKNVTLQFNTFNMACNRMLKYRNVIDSLTGGSLSN
jgi:hypothetical protein